MGGGCGQTSIAGSLLVAYYAFTGPVASRLVSKFGTRKVCIAGAIIAATGLSLGSFTTSLVGAIATYSIVTGVGFGLMYIPSIVAVANHFTKKRSLAIGICLCGAGFGTIALSPLETFITQNYGWRWGFLSLAGLSLSCCLCGLAMREAKRGESSTARGRSRRYKFLSARNKT
jgi:MFS family permease